MKLSKRLFTLSCLASLAVPALAQPKQTLPSMIRLVVPASPGAATDVMARTLAHQLGIRTGSTVIVENKPGAATMLGSTSVAKGPKDGSVLLINSNSLASTGASMKNPPIHVLNDLEPVAVLEQNPLVIAASTKSGIKTPADLVAAARSRELTHGTTGVASVAHYAQEQLADAIGGKFNHVPYKGASLAVTDLSSGIIDLVIASWNTVAPAVRAGRAVAVAVTSAQPNPAFPHLPTMASAASGYNFDLWVGVYAPRGTPETVIRRLNTEINEVSKSEKMREIYAMEGGVPLAETPAQFKQRLQQSYAHFKKLGDVKSIAVD